MTNNTKYEYVLPIGTKLRGREYTYHIEDVLGQGGYGITYKVWTIIKNGQIPVKVPFAIKEHFVNGRCHRAADGVTVEYSQEAAEDVEESLKDFVKEGRLLNKICQADDEAVKYIVPVNEVIETNNTAYFVMQYLEGGSLRRMVLAGQGGLSEDNALALIKPIARAVDFIHRHKVLHMDIKPENIVMHRNLLTGQEEPVLIDFGVSLHFNKKGGLTSKHTSFGHTEGFSPIEQYGAVETFAPWTDVYALGATLYYLLTGKTPPKAFDMTPDDVDKNLPSTVGKRTRAAIKHAMVKDYHDRTQSASTFLWELENDYEPAVMKAPDKQKDVEDTNLTIKKKVTPKPNPNPAIKIFLRQLASALSDNARRIGMGLLLLVVAYGVYLLFKSIDSSKGYSVDTEEMKYDSIEKDRISKEKKSSIEEELELTPIESGPNEEAEMKRKAKATPQQETANKPQQENKAEAKPEKKEKPEPKAPSDAEIFEQAYKAKDWVTIEKLGNKGYSKAYYPLALHYYNKGEDVDCKKWSQKAINAGVQTEAAKKLLNEVQ